MSGNSELSGVVFSDDFWKYFSENYWEKNTYVSSDIVVDFPASESEIFNAIVSICNDYLSNVNSSHKISFFIANYRYDLHGNPQFLPNRKDKSFSGYAKRMQGYASDNGYALVMDCIDLPPAAKGWFFKFLKKMQSPINKIYAGGHFVSLFFGEYKITPSGVHTHNLVDSKEGAFYFPIKGSKTMLTWTSDYADSHPELKYCHNYTEHIEHSVPLCTSEKGMMYWPSDRWHVGSSGHGDLALVLAASSRVNGKLPILKFLKEYLNDNPLRQYSKIYKLLCYAFISIVTFASRNNQPGHSLSVNIRSATECLDCLPEQLDRFFNRYRYFFPKKEFEIIKISYWLMILSTGGLNYGRVMKESISDLDDVVSLERCVDLTVLYKELDKQTVVYSCNSYIAVISLDLHRYIVKEFGDFDMPVELGNHCLETMRTEVFKLGESVSEFDEFMLFLVRSDAFLTHNYSGK